MSRGSQAARITAATGGAGRGHVGIGNVSATSKPRPLAPGFPVGTIGKRDGKRRASRATARVKDLRGGLDAPRRGAFAGCERYRRGGHAPDGLARGHHRGIARRLLCDAGDPGRRPRGSRQGRHTVRRNVRGRGAVYRLPRPAGSHFCTASVVTARRKTCSSPPRIAFRAGHSGRGAHRLRARLPRRQDPPRRLEGSRPTTSTGPGQLHRNVDNDVAFLIAGARAPISSGTPALRFWASTGPPSSSG